jgi:hypothetical protein
MKILARKYNLKHGSNDIISENLGIQILNTEKNKISDNICQKSDSSCQYSDCNLITEIFHGQTNTCDENHFTNTSGCNVTPISDQILQVENNQFEFDDSVNCFKSELSAVSCQDINNSSVFCSNLRNCEINSNLVQGNIKSSDLNFGDIEKLSFDQLCQKFQIECS